MTWKAATAKPSQRITVQRPEYNPDGLGADVLHRLHACSPDEVRLLAASASIPVSALHNFFYRHRGLRRAEMARLREAIAKLPPLKDFRESLVPPKPVVVRKPRPVKPKEEEPPFVEPPPAPLDPAEYKRKARSWRDMLSRPVSSLTDDPRPPFGSTKDFTAEQVAYLTGPQLDPLCAEFTWLNAAAIRRHLAGKRTLSPQEISLLKKILDQRRDENPSTSSSCGPS
jgi:hypothetical protein